MCPVNQTQHSQTGTTNQLQSHLWQGQQGETDEKLKSVIWCHRYVIDMTYIGTRTLKRASPKYIGKTMTGLTKRKSLMFDLVNSNTSRRVSLFTSNIFTIWSLTCSILLVVSVSEGNRKNKKYSLFYISLELLVGDLWFFSWIFQNYFVKSNLRCTFKFQHFILDGLNIARVSWE